MDEIIDVEDLRKLKLPELKALCKQNGIPSSGAKEVLVKRLAVSMGMDEEDEGVDEDALLEEEEDKEESGGSSSEKEQSSEPVASNETTNDSVVEGAKAALAPSPKKEAPPAIEKDKENETVASPTKKIKLIEAPPADPPKPVSQLTDAERLKLRAEKYGVSTAKGALSSKEARAARFGMATSGDKKTASPAAAKGGAASAKNLSADDLEKMKQRSQRFGSTVSSAMSNVDNMEKILKRKERFGEVASSATGKSSDSAKEKRAARFGLSNATTVASTTTKSSSSTEMDELKRKRAERFKITA